MKTGPLTSPANGTRYQQIRRSPTFRNTPQLNFDIPDTLLAEVDFKWLMAGHGFWVNTTRFHSDAAYASQLLQWAMGSESASLRVCAAALLQRLEEAAPGGTSASQEPAGQSI